VLGRPAGQRAHAMTLEEQRQDELRVEVSELGPDAPMGADAEGDEGVDGTWRGHLVVGESGRVEAIPIGPPAGVSVQCVDRDADDGAAGDQVAVDDVALQRNSWVEGMARQPLPLVDETMERFGIGARRTSVQDTDATTEGAGRRDRGSCLRRTD
jgi:hypothetical protein